MTGGGGFLGSYLVEALLEQGHEVICLDNFFTGSKDNILHLLGRLRFELLRHDVVEPILLKVNQVYNLACPARPVYYQYKPVKMVKTNVMGTLRTYWAWPIGSRPASCRPPPARSTATGSRRAPSATSVTW